MNQVGYSIYINREDLHSSEEEEVNKFVVNILENIGLDFSEVWPNPPSLSIEEKVKLINFLSKYEMEIIYDGDRGYKIYVDNEIIGEWFKPRVLLKRDDNALSLSKRLFFEVQFKYSSIFEEK